MLWVEPGSFNIGNRDTRIDIEIPEGIWLGKFPVTQQQFDVIMETNPSCFKLADGDLPVEQVSWRDAQQFCNELTLLMPEDLEVPLEFRLPKEAEWTHACRAGNETTYGYGDNERLFNEYGWYSGNSGNRTRRVGLKKPNPWGFHDMHGNVWEWCFDRDKRFSLRVLSDLKGKDREEIRAVRGGSWSSLVYACRTTNRNWYPPQETSSNVGFRVALVPRSK
jgi:formylglycine-generating enzyme required for sulfatase activity